jgi:haloalkane dehalogenase
MSKSTSSKTAASPAARRPSPPAAFPFEPRYVEILGHRIHHVEEGEGDPVLFIHGNPTSSYAYRNVIGPVAKATGRRCIAMDLLGLGKSEKPSIDYTCRLHADVISGLIEVLDLNRIALVAEDWGGFLGAYVMTKRPSRFETAVLMETFLWPMTYADDYDPSFVMPFKLMRSPIGGLFSKGMNVMVNKLIPEHCPISTDSLDYYRQSLPTFRSRKALGDFPRLLPTDGKPRASHDFALELQDGLARVHSPVLWIKADPGVVVSPLNPCGYRRLDELQKRLPQLEIRDFGPGFHFLTEENPSRVADMVSSWLNEIRTQSSHANTGGA